MSTDRLAVGDLVLLYSDGILERPGRTIQGSGIELAHVAADSAAGRALHDPDATPAERVCTQTVELLVRTTGHSDDITLLAAQRVDAPAALDLILPAEPQSLRPCRAEIAAWLLGLGATAHDLFLLQHAFGELLTNAIEHAFDSGPRPERPVVTLHATLDPEGYVQARITDQGRWREPARVSSRGRGLALTSHLVESVRVEPSPTGTVATLRHPLTRPARMLGAEQPVIRPAPAAEFEVRSAEPGADRVLVAGPVDALTAARLHQELLRRSRGGTLPLTVDLTAVTHLASAGVSALHRVAGQHVQQGGKLTLEAAPGSPARQVLTLVAIPNVGVGPAA